MMNAQHNTIGKDARKAMRTILSALAMGRADLSVRIHSFGQWAVIREYPNGRGRRGDQIVYDVAAIVRVGIDGSLSFLPIGGENESALQAVITREFAVAMGTAPVAPGARKATYEVVGTMADGIHTMRYVQDTRAEAIEVMRNFSNYFPKQRVCLIAKLGSKRVVIRDQR